MHPYLSSYEIFFMLLVEGLFALDSTPPLTLKVQPTVPLIATILKAKPGHNLEGWNRVEKQLKSGGCTAQS